MQLAHYKFGCHKSNITTSAAYTSLNNQYTGKAHTVTLFALATHCLTNLTKLETSAPATHRLYYQ